ncbi:MAG: polysaccharide biosynthesis protein [Lachnospiraceae bacterium]|jgi:stage V sporulation protein B|nr:polysaccharide biosynthesis protein [Lachnospiraceae bacterium]
MSDKKSVSQSQGRNNKKDGFIMQAGILAAASIICRMIGLLYRGPLTGIIGDEGNGYYSTAYNIYTIVLLVSSYSIPSAIAKVLAQRLALKEYRNAQRIFKCALVYVMVVGGAASLILFIGAPYFVMGNSIPVLRVFAPTIFFYGLLGVLRGYFQAHRTMMQTSVSQILEQILNAAVSLGAAYVLMQTAVSAGGDGSTQAMYGAVGSAVGTGAGVVIALLFMAVIYMMNRKMIKRRAAYDRTETQESYWDIFKLMMAVVTPFILSTCIYNLTTSLNQTIYLKMMVKYKEIDVIAATTELGIFSSKAVTISNIPIALASAMSAAIVPTIASTYAQGSVKQTKKKVAYAIKVTMLISIPAAVGIGVLARPVMMVLFPQLESLELASRLLMGLSATVVLYGLSTLTNAALQGIGKVNTPVINATIAIVIQTAVLVSILYYTDWGVYGVMTATVLYSFFMCVLNNVFMKKYLGYKQEIDKTFARPVFSAVLMGAAAYGIYEGMGYVLALFMESAYFMNLIAFATAALIGAMLYFVLVIKLKAVKESDLRGLPKGKMIIKVARKMKLL